MPTKPEAGMGQGGAVLKAITAGAPLDAPKSTLPIASAESLKASVFTQTPEASDVLARAQSLVVQRGQAYDGAQERSMPAVVTMFNTMTGHNLTTEQGWKFMVLLKLVRSEAGDYKPDNYDDGTAYLALAGEQAAKDRIL